MELIKDIYLLREKINRIGKDSVGLIHTKGKLHEGHRRLIEAARKDNVLVIVSNILVPREFNSLEAYDLYPKCTQNDLELASHAGADFFFSPELEAFEAGEQLMGIHLSSPLKGEMNGLGRPHYYDEKLTTLVKVLNIVRPNRMYMSDRDLQFIYFTSNLLSQFQYRCELKILPAVRDEDNLFLSGKKCVLKGDEKRQVKELSKIFAKAQTAVERGMLSARKLKWHVENEMAKLYLCKLEFVEIVEPERLRKIETITDVAILILGVRVGKIRICDYTYLKKVMSKE